MLRQQPVDAPEMLGVSACVRALASDRRQGQSVPIQGASGAWFRRRKPEQVQERVGTFRGRPIRVDARDYAGPREELSKKRLRDAEAILTST